MWASLEVSPDPVGPMQLSVDSPALVLSSTVGVIDQHVFWGNMNACTRYCSLPNEDNAVQSMAFLRLKLFYTKWRHRGSKVSRALDALQFQIIAPCPFRQTSQSVSTLEASLS